METYDGLSSLNWSLFLLFTLIILGMRFSVKKLLPVALISTITAGTAGFILFLGLGVLGYSQTIDLPVYTFSLLAALGYASFLLGAIILQIFVGQKLPAQSLTLAAKREALIAIMFCIVYVLFSVEQFIANGGIPKAIDLLFGGHAHREYLTQLNDLESLRDGGLNEFFYNVTFGVFLCFWIIGFTRFPRFSTILYGFAILPTFGNYASRTELLRLLVVPLLAYYSFFRPSRQVMITQLIAVTVAAIVFFSWDSAIRLGQTYDISIDRLVSDTLRDGGNSVEPASAILMWNWRYRYPIDYWVSLIGFPIPRFIWPSKPLLFYNIDITYLYTGRPPGPGNSIRTSTMLGEGWYYFGINGTFILMALFGAYAQLMDLIFSRTTWTLGVYYVLVYLSFILFRSTFMTYYQTGVSFLFAAGIVMFIRFLTLNRTIESNGQVEMKSPLLRYKLR